MVEWEIVKRVFVIRIFVNRKGLSLRTIPRACERESEAIPSKAATTLNNVRDSSFR